jgi:hypothetical protein
LVFVDQRDYLLKPVGKKFSDQFHGDVKGDRSIFRQTGRALNFGDQSDKR